MKGNIKSKEKENKQMNEKISFKPVQHSPFDRKTKLRLLLWHIINITVYRWSPFFMRKFRVALMRMFGAKIDWSCSLNRLAIVDGPWFLSMGPHSSLQDGVWIRCRAPVTIGANCCIGKDVYIMTGSHRLSSPTFELTTAPVVISDSVWIATKSFVHKGSVIGEGAVVAACSVVAGEIEPWTVVGGNPAKFIKKRELKV